jgi:hypothetical protein
MVGPFFYLKGFNMIYFLIWFIIAFLGMGALASIININDDNSTWIIPAAFIWPLSILILIGYALGYLGKKIYQQIRSKCG